jgi:hypothetical protein
MPVKYYTCFGVANRVTDVLMDTVNPLASDVVEAQIRPYDGGANPMFSIYGSVDSSCDITWVLRANQEVYHPLKVTPNTVAIIRSKQLRTILDGVPYLGNRIYLVSLNGHPLIYSDYEYPRRNVVVDDISGGNIASYHRDFITAIIEPFTPSLMTKIFIQYDYNMSYSATDVRNWVANGNMFLNLYGYDRKYNGGGEALSSATFYAGNKIRVKKSDVCLSPLTSGMEYILTRNGYYSYWSSLPSLAGWTTNVILAYVKDTTEYPFVIELVNNTSGGVLLSIAGSTSVDNRVGMPGWWFPIIVYQYLLGKAGYLGVSPTYVTED